MKKSIITFASVLALIGCTCQRIAKTQSVQNDSITEIVQEKPMTGTYSEYHELSEEELELFKSTYKGDVELTPKAVATQVVSGTNYSYRCADTSESEYLVTIFVPLPCYRDEQKTKVTSVEKQK